MRLPTPVAANNAAFAASEAGQGRGGLYEDDLDIDDNDSESLSEEYISTVRLNVLIGIVVLLVVTAVGTAMLLSISKIWGNHQDNVWLEEHGATTAAAAAADEKGHHQLQPRFLHPKDLSSFLFQYEIRHQRYKSMLQQQQQLNLTKSSH